MRYAVLMLLILAARVLWVWQCDRERTNEMANVDRETLRRLQ